METTKQEVLFSTSMLKKLKQLKEHDIVAAYLLNDNYLVEDGIHHITIRDGENLISFCPKGKEQEYNDDGEWSLAGRQTMRIGRMVRMVLKPHIAVSDASIEGFTKRLQNEYEGKKPYDLQLVKGRDIAKWYYSGQYVNHDDSEQDCSLWASCMRYSDCQDNDFFDLYVYNPEKVQMLIMVRSRDNMLLARAIVWLLDDGRYFLDRIYCADQKYIHVMQRHAMDKGWLYKYNMSNDQYTIALPDGNRLQQKDAQFIITGLDTDFSHFPYVDTFRFLYRANNKQGFMANHVCEVNGKTIGAELCDTDGEYTPKNIVRCCKTNELRDIEDCREITYGDKAYLYAVARYTVSVYLNNRSYRMLRSDTAEHGYDGTDLPLDMLVMDCEGCYCLPDELRLSAKDGKYYANWKREFLEYDQLRKEVQNDIDYEKRQAAYEVEECPKDDDGEQTKIPF